MAGLWSRKFDRVNGEDRVCKICGEGFHAVKPSWRCKPCINKAQKIIEEKKRANYDKKALYPFDNYTNAAGNRFCSIRTALSRAWKEYRKTGDKSVIFAHYEKQLREAEQLGILTWIYDRRDAETARENSIKSVKLIRQDYPDTRGWYEE
jgi:hypothetical protein